MRKLYYTIRTLIRGRVNNIAKIISLTLGLLVSILLFARVVFEVSFNKNYYEADKLYYIMCEYTVNHEKRGEHLHLYAPVPRTIREFFPEQIQSATVFGQTKAPFFHNNVRTEPDIVIADSLYFQTMGIPVLKGNVRELGNPDVVFLSESFARQVFGGDDPVGKSIMWRKNHQVIVRGVYADIPENSSIKHEAVISLATTERHDLIYTGWNGGDAFRGVVRLRDNKDLDFINTHMQAAIEPHLPFNNETGFGADYRLKSMNEVYLSNPAVKRIIWIMSVLGFSVLLIAAFNYVLISVSSLSRRAKGVGVYKCNGATTGDIFSMFLWETAIIICISLLLVFFLIINFQGFIEDIIEVSLSGLFTWATLWTQGLVVLVLFIIAGIIPGKIFSSIPVTQVFRKYSKNQVGWKRILLSVQFGGVTFIFGLLLVIASQYREIMNYDLGYNPDGVVTSFSGIDKSDVGKNTILNLPMVESVGLSMDHISYGLSGESIYDETGNFLFTTRINACDPDYVSLMEFEIIQGRNMEVPGQALVNEEFIRQRKITGNPIGQRASGQPKSMVIIAGVVKDFVSGSLYSPPLPILLEYDPEWMGRMSVRLKAPYEENLRALNKSMQEIFPTKDIVFTSLREKIDQTYLSVRRFRDAVIIAFISIILISLTGLIGYVNDEVFRKSKEIAIRKVNGAGSSDILRLLSREVMYIALPSTLLGAVCSYFIGIKWLEQFRGAHINPGIYTYIIIVLVTLLFIIGCVVSKSWRIANEDPVKSVKSE